MAQKQKIPSNVQDQINKQVAEAKAKAEEAKARALGSNPERLRQAEQAKAAAIAKRTGTTSATTTAQTQQASVDEKVDYEKEIQERLASQQAEYDKQLAALQSEQRNQQAAYDNTIRNLQSQIDNRQADYDAKVKALQDQLASNKTGYETKLQEQAAANQAAQDTALANQKTELESAFRQQQEAERNSAKNRALADLKEQYGEVGAYTAKTSDEINQQARDELQSTYDKQLLAARQAQEKQDLALAQQEESVGRSYDKQREQTNKTYDQNVSAADRRALSRGMQRSSYNNQTLANIDSERAKALQDINEQQVNAEGNIAAQRAQLASQLADTERSYAESMEADIRARTKELESQEYDREFQNRQLRSQLASDLYNKEYGQTRDDVSDTQWTKTFEEGQRQFNEGQELTRSENALNRAFQTSEREATQNYQSNENALNRAFQTSEREATQAYNTSEREAQQAYTTSEREASQNWQSSENALNREQNQAQFEAQQEQWREEFEYNKMSDEQKMAYNYVTTILGNGGNPSDELLAQAGLSRADANAMKQQVSSGGGGGSTGTSKTGNTNGDKNGTTGNGLDLPGLNSDANSTKKTSLISGVASKIYSGAKTAAGTIGTGGTTSDRSKDKIKK